MNQAHTAGILKGRKGVEHPPNRLIVPVCPYCAEEHRHGGPKGEIKEDPTHRNSHCHDGGYYIHIIQDKREPPVETEERPNSLKHFTKVKV